MGRTSILDGFELLVVQEASTDILVHVAHRQVSSQIQYPAFPYAIAQSPHTVVRALALWNSDPTLVLALETSKMTAKRVETLMMCWPNIGTQSPRMFM